MPSKILLIDDEELVTKSISRLLSKEGYEVIVCKSGEEAIEQARKERIDLIVCDIRMPRLNGVETIKNIRQMLASGRRGAIPEILITGYADEEANRQAEALQVADYLYKPFDLRDFLACVKKNLKG